jgi:DNA-3-methyladenine glycosylase II
MTLEAGATDGEWMDAVGFTLASPQIGDEDGASSGMDGNSEVGGLLQPLTLETLGTAAAELARRDPDLARILDRTGPPPLWKREPGFPTLVHIILEQQVSLASAKAAYDRVGRLIEPFTPDRFLTLDEEALKQAGFSRQKIAYARSLARDLASGQFELESLAALPDEEVMGRLVALHGIGRWSAGIYLLMVLCRPDIWPVGDLALVTSMQRSKGLDQRPDEMQMQALAEPWRPWRAVAARLLWADYLADREERKSGSRR